MVIFIDKKVTTKGLGHLCQTHSYSNDLCSMLEGWHSHQVYAVLCLAVVVKAVLVHFLLPTHTFLVSSRMVVQGAALWRVI